MAAQTSNHPKPTELLRQSSVWAFSTFTFLGLNYMLLVMLEPTGATEQWVVFAGWGLLIIAAAVVAFQTQLRATFRRLAAAFE